MQTSMITIAQKIECIQKQLDELMLLQCTYSEDELHIEDEEAVNLLTYALENSTTEALFPTERLGFTFSLKLENNLKVDIVFHLPHTYPAYDTPTIIIRCNDLQRPHSDLLNQDLLTFIKNDHEGEPCVMSVLQWISENLFKYLKPIEPKEEPPVVCNNTVNTWTRLWIYSHHIYNFNKRKVIVEWAQELNLSGFCLPGKPGLVCVEGETKKVEEYWHRVKKLTWKHICAKDRDDAQNCAFADFQKFPGEFCELELNVRSGKGREYHMDLSEFFKFLISHDCGDKFKCLFGFEGHLKVEAKT